MEDGKKMEIGHVNNSFQDSDYKRNRNMAVVEGECRIIKREFLKKGDNKNMFEVKRNNSAEKTTMQEQEQSP